MSISLKYFRTLNNKHKGGLVLGQNDMIKTMK